MVNKRWYSMVCAIVLTGGLLWAGGEREASVAGEEVGYGLRAVTVLLEWVPNTNHTGVFVAACKGWYEEEGLDVEVMESSEIMPPVLIAAGQGDFGFAPQEMIVFARASKHPVPVVSIAAVNRHNTSVFASPSQRGITSVADFEGMRYGGWGSDFEDALITAVMNKAGVDFSTVEVINVGAVDFLSSFGQGIDFRWIFYGWDGIRAKIEGREFNYLSLIDIDPKLDYYTPTIICSEDMLKKAPGTVKAFLRATERGYRYAAAHPEEAADTLLMFNEELDPAFARASQKYLSAQYLDEDGEWGRMSETLWRNFGDFLYEYGLLDEPFDASSSYTNDFLP